MKKLIKKHLISGEHNNHSPHLLRDSGVSALFLTILVVFSLLLLQSRFLGGSSFLASVLPNILVDLANEDRADFNLSHLTVNETLVAAAQLKANDMAARGYFAHNTPEGLEPWYFFQQAGYDYLYAGENLAINFSDSDAVEKAWMNSPLHRDNILGAQFTEVGIATAEGYYEGKKTTFVVQLFGSPRVASIPAASAPVAVETVPEVAAAPAATEVSEPAVLADTETFSPTPVEKESVKRVAEEVAEPEAEYDLASEAVEVATSPSRILEYIYLVLALLIVTPILSILVREIKRHHRKQVVAGGALLSLMALLLFVTHGLLFLEVSVL